MVFKQMGSDCRPNAVAFCLCFITVMFLKEEEKSGKGNNSGLWGHKPRLQEKGFFPFLSTVCI